MAGLACSTFAIYFCLLGIFQAAMILMIWAVLFDWFDGIIARKMKDRTASHSAFGGQLDILIDIVSYGVTPSILLLSYANYDPIFLAGSFIILTASALRLSYFSTFGLSNKSRYTGLALDNNSIILVFIFLFEGLHESINFSVVLYASTMILSILNVSRLSTPKLSGNPINVYLLSTYTLVITSIYGWMLLT